MNLKKLADFISCYEYALDQTNTKYLLFMLSLTTYYVLFFVYYIVMNAIRYLEHLKTLNIYYFLTFFLCYLNLPPPTLIKKEISIIQNNQRHFAQAEGTPPTKPPLSKILGNSHTHSCDKILNGMYIPPEDIPMSMKYYLEEMER